MALDIEYGIGGGDPNDPEANVVSKVWVDDPTPPASEITPSPQDITQLTPEQVQAIMQQGNVDPNVASLMAAVFGSFKDVAAANQQLASQVADLQAKINSSGA